MDLSPRRARASSAALDTLLFVVLVGAAVAVFATATPADAPTGRITEETSDVLATSTATVEFSRTGTMKAGGTEHAVSVRRTAHGTYAELLAATAVASATLDGESLTDSGGSLGAAVQGRTRRVLGMRDANARVVAVWRPYPGAPITGRTAVGQRPPPDAAVAATTMSVPSGVENVTDEALQAAGSGGFEAVARVVSRHIVTGLFPRARTSDALRSDGPDRVIARHRYRTIANVLGVEIGDALDARNLTAANGRLVERMTRRLKTDLDEQYRTPAAAARHLRIERVTVVVRTWSP